MSKLQSMSFKKSASIPLLEQTTTIEDIAYVYKLKPNKPIFSGEHSTSFDPRFGSIWESTRDYSHSLAHNANDHDMDDETRQRELEKTFFRLSLLGVSISCFGWIAIMIILYLFGIVCDNFLNCILLNADALATQCTNSNNIGMKSTTENIILIVLPSIIIFLSFLYAIVWQIFWQKSDNKLQIIHKKEMESINIDTLTQLETITKQNLSLIKKQTRKYQSWCILLFCTLLLLGFEWFISFMFDGYFVDNIIGRNLYRIIVLTLGGLLIKLINVLTQFEYSLIIDDCNEFEIPHNIKQYWTQHKRNTLFHRKLIIMMINFTVAIYFPAIDHYPHIIKMPDEENLKIFLLQLNWCAVEATFFIWGSVLGSQLLAFSIEFGLLQWKKKFLKQQQSNNQNIEFNRIPSNSCDLSTIESVNEDSNSDDNENENDNNDNNDNNNENNDNNDTINVGDVKYTIDSKQSKCVTMIVTLLSKIAIEKLYFLHENWFLAVILHMFGLTFAWLNPSMLFLSALTILLLAIIYKIRFVKLKPSVVYLYVPDLIFSETLFFILMILLPTIFIMLLPLWHYCWPISFGSVTLGALLTAVVVMIRYIL